MLGDALGTEGGCAGVGVRECRYGRQRSVWAAVEGGALNNRHPDARGPRRWQDALGNDCHHCRAIKDIGKHAENMSAWGGRHLDALIVMNVLITDLSRQRKMPQGF